MEKPDTGIPTKIPCSEIEEGFNYRRRYNAEKMQSLADSIKSQGLMHAVTVRKLLDGDKYQLLVGGRRFKAFVKAFGPEAEIPANVRVCSDAEATALMLSENNERDDPSVIEDAEGANRMLGLCRGDRDEAARRLGWKPHKLDRRLALMNAIDQVRDAYLEEKILVGHVEILAALRKEVQQKVITAILALPICPTVVELKAMAQQALLSLDSAIFDKVDCARCQFNTGHQQAMFDESFEGSSCTNQECYSSKTEAELENRRSALTETYQVVRIVRTGDNSTVSPLRAEGDNGVGQAQAQACRACGDFGACVSAVPDKLGRTFKDMCFNSVCLSEKVSQAKAAAQKEAKAQARAQAEQQKSDPAKKISPPKDPASSGSSTPEKPDAKPTIATTRNGIKEYRDAAWRLILARVITQLPHEGVLAVLAMILVSFPSNLSSSRAREAIEKACGFNVPATGTDSKLELFLGIDADQLKKALAQIAASLDGQLGIRDIASMLATLKVDIRQHWKLSEDFLKILTKVEIEAVCDELGISEACGKKFASLKTGSKDDFIKGVLNVEGFQYLGAVPSMMDFVDNKNI